MTTKADDVRLRTEILLVVQVALLGMVEPSLRAVTVGWTPNTVEAILYFDGRLREQDAEHASDIEAEIMAGFPDHEVAVVARRVDYPEPPPIRMAWAYWRKEPLTSIPVLEQAPMRGTE